MILSVLGKQVAFQVWLKRLFTDELGAGKFPRHRRISRVSGFRGKGTKRIGRISQYAEVVFVIVFTQPIVHHIIPV
ncbi:hypothetical protein D3C73_1462340 [compost metagenome]